jgi:nucleotide-binding universal stress UspA family protein
MARIERILCPVDFSDGSRRAVDHALAIARWYNADVTALHVTPPITLAPYMDPLVHPTPLVRTSEDLDKIRLQLALFVEEESGDFSVASVVKEGGIVAEILRFADTNQADLVVMGTHGRSGFRRFILGSVTESVLRHSTRPVLIVPLGARRGAGWTASVQPDPLRRGLFPIFVESPRLCRVAGTAGRGESVASCTCSSRLRTMWP